MKHCDGLTCRNTVTGAGCYCTCDACDPNGNTLAELMRRRPVAIPDPGLYRIWWTSGGSSLAAVGVTREGGRWLAPINWTTPLTVQDIWTDGSILRADLVADQTGEVGVLSYCQSVADDLLGGYHAPGDLEIFRHGMSTIMNALTARLLGEVKAKARATTRPAASAPPGGTS